ncbi:uncharacterized protein [Paralichthys olivaceus]|uniref:uncharacterized protein isoform X2 n=1 Tax=Paralichthys olivaceus TaxID=8255 RepID=UPI003750F0F6
MENHQTTREARAVSEHLEDAGNCWQNIYQEPNLPLLCDSLLSEQRKLRHVLDWAHNFLSSGSELHREFCRAESLILATEKDEETRETEVFEGGRRASYENQENFNFLCGFKFPLQDEPDVPFSRRDELNCPEKRESENIKSVKPQHTTNKQSPSQDYCTTNRLNLSNQRPQTHISDGSRNQTLASATCEEATSCWSNVICEKRTVSSKRDSEDRSYKINEAQKIKKEVKKRTEGMVEGEKEKKDAGLEEEDGNKKQGATSSFLEFANDKMSHSEIPFHLKTPSNLTVYEQYQLCVDRLHRLRMRPGIEAGCFSDSPAQEMETCEEAAASARPPSRAKFNSSTSNPEIEKYFSETTTKTEDRTSDDLYKNKDRTSDDLYKNKDRTSDDLYKNKDRTSDDLYKNKDRTSDDLYKNKDRTSASCSRTTLTKLEETKHGDNLTLRKNRRLSQTSSVYCNKHGDLIKRPAGAKSSTDKLVNTHVEDSRREERAAPPADSVLQPKKTERHPGLKKSDVKGPQRFNEKSSMSLSSLTNEGILPRSAAAIQRTKRQNAQTHTKRHTPEDRLKQLTVLQPTETHKHHNDDTRPTLASDTEAHESNTDYKHTPAAVPACDHWLRLPDEVWLSILSLLPHTDLCRVTQVCSRLHTLATDHTLWKNLRIENETLTEQRLLFWGTRRPRSLCLYSCSGPSVTSHGLQMFFTLCKNHLEDVKVTSCTGPGLHGDQILPQIGQLCDHVTSVDVSWSGATDVGVKALSDGCAGLRLKSVVLNGCHVTDDPLKKLVMRHRESLCRLEVFGCQFLSASCLQAIYEMCPGLKHLNVGQVPKVNAHSLTVMASQLKCLISLNLTGLQAVTDVTVSTLLQNCVELESLTLGSCRGVTDLTLHNISKYTPCIRSLDVSGCKAVTDVGVQSLTLGCRRLQQLDLSSTGAGNRGLKLLHVYGCAHLPSEREIGKVNAIVKVYPLS